MAAMPAKTVEKPKAIDILAITIAIGVCDRVAH